MSPSLPPMTHAASFRCQPKIIFQSQVQEDEVVVPDMLINVLFRDTGTVSGYRSGT
ncbi:MAG: hypothetical protein WCB46_04010 [Methanoregula sp.]